MERTGITGKKKGRRKKGTLICLMICLILTGYPLAANWLFERQQDLVRAGYEKEAGSRQKESRTKEWEKAAAHNRKLLAGSEEAKEAVMDYEDCLNLGGDGIIGFLEIPKLQLMLPIYHGVEESVLQKGLGHLPQTALPIGQEGAHVGITGHSGLSDKRLFSDLEQLEEGDGFRLYVMDKTLCYRVEQIKTVLPTQTEDLEAREGKDYVTLITCTPYGINDHRLLVRGVRAEEEEVIAAMGEFREPDEAGGSGFVRSTWKKRYRKAVAFGLCLSSAMVIVYLSGRRFLEHRKREANHHHPDESRRRPGF